MTYLADSEDSKVKALYTLLKDDLQQDKGFKLTDEQMQILEEEHQLHITGQSKSYTREEANQIIRVLRDF